MTSTPGAVTSGFSCSDSGVGPADEKPAITSAGPESPSVDAATVIAFAAVPGDPTEPRPASPKSLPSHSSGWEMTVIIARSESGRSGGANAIAPSAITTQTMVAAMAPRPA